MNRMVRPPLPSGDDLDGLLRAFYRAQMPSPWPALKAPPQSPARRPTPGPRAWPLLRSRLALAASVALLVLASLLFSGKLADPGKELRLPGTADRLDEKKWIESLYQPKDGPTMIKIEFPADVPPVK